VIFARKSAATSQLEKSELLLRIADRYVNPFGDHLIPPQQRYDVTTFKRPNRLAVFQFVTLKNHLTVLQRIAII